VDSTDSEALRELEHADGGENDILNIEGGISVIDCTLFDDDTTLL
jgi:hypothetical protein